MVNNLDESVLWAQRPSEVTETKVLPSPKSSPIYWWFAPCIVGTWLLLTACVVVSAVAGTVWIVRQALGV